MTDHETITCAGVDSMLLDYLEETLDGTTRTAVDEHVASCLRCNALMRDIGSIRADAAKLPELAPSRDLWPGIAARIEPTVVPLARQHPAARRTWIPAAAAAAVLVVATAGITYVATSRSLQSSAQKVAVATRPQPIATNPVPVEAAPKVAETSAQDAAATVVAEQSTPSKSSTGASLASRNAITPADIAYGDEIARLQNIVAEKRRQLDPATVSVIEESLKIIDVAVRQSRAALARDPKSGFLSDQLNHALDKKIELLRTVALLPSRT
jgi:hypothetical protein